MAHLPPHKRQNPYRYDSIFKKCFSESERAAQLNRAALSSCPIISASHDPQLPKPLNNILIHPLQPLLLKPLLATTPLHNLLQMLANKRHKIDPMHRITVHEFALTYVFGGLWFGR